jgi:ribonuclease HII
MSAGNTHLTAGMDEVGRGCIAGPVVAAIVILGLGVGIDGMTDSKQLTSRRREDLALQIKEKSVAWAIGRAEPGEIDRINILQASLLAMQRAYAALTVRPQWVKVDGNRYPRLPCNGEAIIGGDLSVPEISAASIVAKVWRDAEMDILDALYPGYGFAGHKGYPTRAHKAKLLELGATPVHRRSFAPVVRALSGDGQLLNPIK